jgi:hypothetical protein
VLEVSATSDLDGEGVFFWLDLPRAEFSGGQVNGAAIPVRKPAERKFLGTEGESVVFRGASGKISLTARTDRALPWRVEDRWDRGGRYYTAGVEFHHGRLSAGQAATLDLKSTLTGEPDSSPAHLRLRANERRYKFDGFGGNYCFGIESPVTD